MNGPAIDADLFDDILSRHEPYDYANRRPEKDSIGAIALSSGSTGNPKGIIHSQYSLLESSRGGQNVFECVSTDDTFLVVMNPSFAAWLMFVLTSMGGKARTFLCGRFEPEKAMEIIQRERVTITALVPAMWRMVLDAGAEQYDLSSLRLVTVGGEAPTATDVSRVRASICRRVTGTYMASESGTASTIVSRTEDLVERGKIGSTGLPAIGADLKIVDPLGNIEDELAIGETGEIVVSGPSIALGYWKEPVLTEKKFVKGWWRSGDLGHLDVDGYLWVNGRVDNVINTGGIKVHAEEVEAALGSHPSISQCAVVGRTDAQFGQRIEAFLIVRDPTVSAESIKAYLKDTLKLGGFKIPKVFHFVSSLPLGKTGKVDRRLLRDGWVEETPTST